VKTNERDAAHLVRADEKLTAFLELEAAIRSAQSGRPSDKRIDLFRTGRLVDIKYHTVRVSDVAARDFRILLYHGTTGCDELPLGGFNVWHKKLKDRSMFFALLNAKAKRAGFKTYDRFAFLCDRQIENRPIKL
jgi:hypothetical protein